MYSTWGDAEGKWFYDCEKDTIANKLAPIKRNLTTSQQLKWDLLRKNNYDATNAPPELTEVKIGFDLESANLNAKKSFMTSRGRFRAVN